jgi:hypothetical protein
MGVLGMRAGQSCQPHNGLAMDSGKTFGLTNPVAFGQVFENRQRFLGRQVRVEQSRALAFREARLTSLTVEEPDVLLFAVAAADREVAGVTLSVEGANRILAAKAGEVVHGCDPSWPVARGAIIEHKSQDNPRLVRIQQP